MYLDRHFNVFQLRRRAYLSDFNGINPAVPANFSKMPFLPRQPVKTGSSGRNKTCNLGGTQTLSRRPVMCFEFGASRPSQQRTAEVCIPVWIIARLTGGSLSRQMLLQLLMPATYNYLLKSVEQVSGKGSLLKLAHQWPIIGDADEAKFSMS